MARTTLVCAACALFARGSFGQFDSPIFVNDSPTSSETLQRARDLIADSNLTTAVEVAQALLDSAPREIVETAPGSGRFVMVREAVHGLLTRNEDLFEAYLRAQRAPAERLLELGYPREVVEHRFLTPAGFDAGIRLAQQDLIAGRVESAWLALERLAQHPGRSGDRARVHADLARLVAASLERGVRIPGAWNVPNDVDGFPEPPHAERYSVELQGPSLELEHLLATPILSRTIDGSAPATATPPNPSLISAAPASSPVVVGDVVYTATDQTVIAWDVLTLQPRWQTGIAGGPSEPQAGIRAMATTPAGSITGNRVAIEGDVLIAVSGTDRRPDRDQQIVCLEAHSGAWRWSRSVNDLGLPESGGFAVVQPPVLAEDTVLVAVGSYEPNFIGVSSHLVALDPRTSEVRWRLTTSTASQGRGRNTRRVPASGMLVHEGVLYLIDGLGVAAAIEVHTGLARWMVRIDSTATLQQRQSQMGGADPVLVEGRLIFLAPASGDLVMLEPQTGAAPEGSSRRAADNWFSIARVGDELVTITRQSMKWGPLDAHFGDRPLRAQQLSEITLQGRTPVVVGERVVLPLRSSLAEYRIERGSIAERVLPIRASGQPLATPDGLLVVQGDAMYAYTSWSIASKVLGERIEADPTDPWPAVTLAEAAAGTGRTDALLPAIDAAIRAIEPRPSEQRAQAARETLFELLLALVAPTPDPRPGTSTLGLDTRVKIASRLQRIEAGFGDTASSLLVSGQLALEAQNPGLALEHYQRILVDPALRNANAIVPSAGVLSAGTEAEIRVRRLVQEFGNELYRQWDIEASRALAEEMQRLPSDPDSLLTIADRYPLSSSAAIARVEAARALRSVGRFDVARHALEQALDTPRDRRADLPDREIVGQIIVTMLDAGQPLAAAARLERAGITNLPLTVDGVEVSLDAASRAHPARRPALGLPRGEATEADQWMPLSMVEHRPGCPAVLVLPRRNHPEGGLLGIAAIDDGTGTIRGNIPQGVLPIAWIDPDHLVGVTESGVQMLIDASTAQVVWENDPGRSMPPIETVRDRPPRLEILHDGEHIAFVRNDGYAQGVDLETGEPLWTRRLDLTRVVHAVQSGQTAIVTGSPTASTRGASRLVAFEIATGRTIASRDLEADVVEIAPTREGNVALRRQQSVRIIDVHAGENLGLLELPQLEQAGGLIAIDGAIIAREGNIRRQNAELTMIDSVSGQVLKMVQLREFMLGNVVVAPVMTPLDDGVALGLGDVAVVLSASGEVTAKYAQQNGMLRGPVVSRDYMYVLHGRGGDEVVPGEGAGLFYTLATIELATGRLVDLTDVPLPAVPIDFALIEGGLMIHSSNRTFMIPLEELEDGR